MDLYRSYWISYTSKWGNLWIVHHLALSADHKQQGSFSTSKKTMAAIHRHSLVHSTSHLDHKRMLGGSWSKNCPKETMATFCWVLVEFGTDILYENSEKSSLVRRPKRRSWCRLPGGDGGSVPWSSCMANFEGLVLLNGNFRIQQMEVLYHLRPYSVGIFPYIVFI
jgi:hypothetical protein